MVREVRVELKKWTRSVYGMGETPWKNWKVGLVSNMGTEENLPEVRFTRIAFIGELAWEVLSFGNELRAQDRRLRRIIKN